MGTAQMAFQVGVVCYKSIQSWKTEMKLVCFYVDPTAFPCEFLHWEKSFTEKHIMSSFFKKSKLYQNILSRTIKNNLPSLCDTSPEIPTSVNQSVLPGLALCCCTGGNALLGQGTVSLGLGNEV